MVRMSPEGTERRLAAIMFTDIVGSTTATARSESAGLELRDRHRALVRSRVERYHGRFIEAPGDESLSTFESAVDAVHAALAIQHALRDETDLRVRTGLHLGETMFRGDEVFGDGVNIAARVRELAAAGEILASAEVARAVQNQPHIETASRGEEKLKGVAHPVTLYAVRGTAAEPRTAAARPVKPTGARARWLTLSVVALLAAASGLAWWMYGGASPPAPIRSIAVLPLDNLSGDPEQEYFADGMTEALIADLAKIGSLRVISRTSSMRYKQTDLSMPEIAAELGVEGLIEGSVLRDGDEVRITAQLIHGPSDAHLWSESYTNTLTSVIRLQSDVALAIAREVRAAITAEEASRIAAPRAVDPEAYTEWLKGRHFRAMHSSEGFRRAVEHFERAVTLDPAFAAAHADLGMAYQEVTGWGWGDPGENIERAREGIRTALRLDPDSSDAHAAAGYVALAYDFDWQKAEEELRRALELNANNAPARKFLVWRLAVGKRYDEAIAVGRSAVELDPLNPYALDALGDAYAASGQHELAIEQRKQTLQLVPDHEGTLLDLAQSYLATGQPEEALRTRQHLDALRGEQRSDWLALVYAQLGRTEEARTHLAQLGQDPDHGWLAAAWAHVVLGEPEMAIHRLERGYERHAWTMLMLNMDWVPFFESLEDHTRYQDLVRRMNFPQ
jgi:TolB-like protein/class 3 adenylate cyclase/Tfp pilus assembly protein PilF